DQSHFTRYFKRIVGVPPRRYTSPTAWHPPRGQAG
ncbi:hypothetical protein AZ15_2551, partial [Bordetella bronchiseptica A1-7]